MSGWFGSSIVTRELFKTWLTAKMRRREAFRETKISQIAQIQASNIFEIGVLSQFGLHPWQGRLARGLRSKTQTWAGRP
jgi:hypothetical protein